MGFCFIIICWFLLVPGRVPGLVSLLFWFSVPSSFPCSFWFRVGFRTCLPTLMAFCSIIICWFLLVPGRVPDLSPYSLAFCSIIICWFLLVPGRVPRLVSLLFWHSVPSSFAGFFWFRVGFRTCLPTLMGFCFIIICWFLLVPGRVPGLVSLLLWVSVPLSFAEFAGSFWFRVGFRTCLPTLWHSVPSSFAGFFWFRVGFRGLSPYSFDILFHRHVRVGFRGWTSWKHDVLLFGIYAGVIFVLLKEMHPAFAEIDLRVSLRGSVAAAFAATGVGGREVSWSQRPGELTTKRPVRMLK